jgi:hypothetical protein
VGHNYTYRVRAYNTAGNSPYSNTATVNVNVAPLAPTQISPNGPGYGPQPVYTFFTTPGAAQYRIRLTPAVGSPSTTAYFTLAQVDPGNTGTGTIPQATALALGSYSWQVQAQNAFGTSPLSALMAFTVGLPPAPIQISPSGAGQSATAPYTFNTVPGATGYRIFYWDSVINPGGVGTRWYTAAEVALGNPAGIGTISIATPHPAGPEYWYVQAQNALGNGPWSPAMAFTVP